DHAIATRYAPDAGDDTRRGNGLVVYLPGGERRELEQRRTGVEQRSHAIARQELAAALLARAGGGVTPFARPRPPRVQLLHLRAHALGRGPELRARGLQLRFDDSHRGATGHSSANTRRVAELSLIRGQRRSIEAGEQDFLDSLVALHKT